MFMDLHRIYRLFQICRELFYALTGALVIFVIMELSWPGIILAYINMNWLLIFWLIVGIVILVVDRKQRTDSR